MVQYGLWSSNGLLPHPSFLATLPDAKSNACKTFPFLRLFSIDVSRFMVIKATKINSWLCLKICSLEKRDAFGFHIINFLFMSSNISSAPAYGVYVSQLICYAYCCSNYSDFLSRHRTLMTRLLSQGYKINHLSITFKKFHGRHTDLVEQYRKNVCQIFADCTS